MIYLCLKSILGIVLLLYPILIFISLDRLTPAQFGIILFSIAALRFLFIKKEKTGSNIGMPITLMLAFIAIYVLATNQIIALRYYPLLCSIVILIAFLYTLYKPPSMIERIARMANHNLSEQRVDYTRRVTQIWTVFFVINSCIISWTILSGSWEIWSLYNGLISYILIGLLFFGEKIVRKYFLKNQS